jgi:hypothetical protein
VAVYVAAPASANISMISIGCKAVTFTYSNFPATGGTATETVWVDDAAIPVATNTFTINGGSGSDTLTLTLGPGTHTIIANTATSSADGPGGAYVVQQVSGCGTPPCPSGTKVNFRWHYSANGSSGSWSGTKTAPCASPLNMGPQAMEGDLKITPGTVLSAGYDFTLPGNNAAVTVSVGTPKVVFAVNCVSGATPSATTLTVSMPTQSYAVTNSDWYPSGDQHSPLVYQGSTVVPDLCAGGQVRLNQGGTFTASVS